MLDFVPNPIALQLGPLPVYWYGIGYAIGLAVAYQILVRLARWAGENPVLVGNGMIVVAIAALVGGRAYHVIDQWALYKDDLLKIVLPPYTGLGVYGGIALGLDRIVMLLAGATNLRDVIMFPMNQQAQDLLMGAPSEVTPKQLRELHIRVVAPEKKA